MANLHRVSGSQAARLGPESACAEAPHVLALSSDLMLSLRIEEAAASAGLSAHTVTSFAELPGALARDGVQLALVDCADPKFPLEETLTLLQERSPRPRVLAFYPHVRKDLEERARAAGCDLLMPRSRLLLDLPTALKSGTGGHEKPSGEAG